MATMTAPSRHMITAWDRLAIGLLGLAGFALSYDALQQVAVAIHVRGSLTFLFPLLVDGFIAYGVRALVVLRGQRGRARLYAWTLFSCATSASIWANALHAVKLNRLDATGSETFRLDDLVVGALSTLAPLALAGAVHLYILMARSADTPPVPDEPDQSATEEDDPEVLSVAREAVRCAGRVNRAVVGTALRTHGHRIGNERLGHVLSRLRAEHERAAGPRA
ncbi:DUF2637 domain-containing protein [Streptomyces sp. NPDC048172]|uniref:DUF2637 domain-containing protein n=1 Tax=Streptomyces sp. NPDC048172 TaxID=3365505 RepID=UPI00371F54E3